MERPLFLLLLLLAGLVSGCTQVEVPVWLIRADESWAVAEGEREVGLVLEEYSLVVERFDPQRRRVTTRWRYRSGVLGGARSRVELRTSVEPPFEVALSVPREVHDGRRWVLRGEDTDRRRELVAALTAQLTRPPEP